jgi:hypothetical protein
MNTETQGSGPCWVGYGEVFSHEGRAGDRIGYKLQMGRWQTTRSGEIKTSRRTACRDPFRNPRKSENAERSKRWATFEPSKTHDQNHRKNVRVIALRTAPTRQIRGLEQAAEKVLAALFDAWFIVYDDGVTSAERDGCQGHVFSYHGCQLN